MNITNLLLKFVMLSNVCIYIYGKSYQSDHQFEQQLDEIREKLSESQNKNEILAKQNDTDATALAKVIQKEPKFFDDFECKYFRFYLYPSKQSDNFGIEIDAKNCLVYIITWNHTLK